MFHEQPLLKAETMLVLSLWMTILESKKFWEMIHNIANSKAIDSAHPMSRPAAFQPLHRDQAAQ